MKRTISIVSTLLISMYTNAQTDTLSAAGEYYLRGVMETASGFKLDKDGSFQFFFSYGALTAMGVVNGQAMIIK